MVDGADYYNVFAAGIIDIPYSIVGGRAFNLHSFLI